MYPKLEAKTVFVLFEIIIIFDENNCISYLDTRAS